MPRAATHAARASAPAPKRASRARPRGRGRPAGARTAPRARVAGRSHAPARAETARRRAAARAHPSARAQPRPSTRPRSRAAGAVRVAGATVVSLPVRSAAGLLDRLLRGRGWIALIGALLAGIVFLNVALLELNGGLATASERAAELRRENADLRSEVSRLSATARIQRLAEEQGMWMPAPDQVTYLRPDVRRDARAAAEALEAGAAVPLVPTE